MLRTLLLLVILPLTLACLSHDPFDPGASSNPSTKTKQAELGTTAPRTVAPTATRKPTREPTHPADDNCDPSYPTICIPRPPPDLDCDDIEDRNFKVVRPDKHYLDLDGDGIGCEQ